MATSKIQTGDKVKVIAGKYKGSVGTVTSTYVSTKKKTPIKRLRVSGIEMQVAYQKGFKAANMPGQMLSKERTLDASNVALVNEKGIVSKSKIEVVKGSKVRILKKTGEQVTKSKPAKKADEKEVKPTKKVKKETK
jgi:large subunit ribosomal protein L24